MDIVVRLFFLANNHEWLHVTTGVDEKVVGAGRQKTEQGRCSVFKDLVAVDKLVFTNFKLPEQYSVMWNTASRFFGIGFFCDGYFSIFSRLEEADTLWLLLMIGHHCSVARGGILDDV